MKKRDIAQKYSILKKTLAFPGKMMYFSAIELTVRVTTI